jgi:hypothetical protein
MFGSVDESIFRIVLKPKEPWFVENVHADTVADVVMILLKVKFCSE